MLISLNELKKLVKIDLETPELLKLIGSRLVEIESVDDWSKKYKKIYAVKVLECEDIEGTHLHLCKINAGKDLNDSIDPEHSGFIQVVCGAPNVKKGMMAVWIAPGAIVPPTFGTDEPFEISERKLRGFMSFGMLAGADELGFGDDHSGIVELDPDFAKPGELISDLFDLNDQIIEVENKSLTHRPDCFGLVGFAREVAGILGEKFVEPLPNAISDLENLTKALTPLLVQISDYKICPRYEALVFDLEKIPEASPYLTTDDIFLFKAGMRPISPIVDLTNLIMLKTGQPLHAFDYDKFIAVGASEKPELGVRLGREKEKLVLLGDEEIELNTNDIVITSNDVPVALAGAMGGESTAIDETTKKVILEIASFSLYNLRKTQMSHGLFSEAITRFTKGRPATDLAPAIVSALAEFSRLGGKLNNIFSASDPKLPKEPEKIRVTVEEINSLLGSEYSKSLIEKTLENVGIKIESDKDDPETLLATPPLWRTDLHIKEDIIEEVGRLLGYDNLPLSFPTRPFVCASVDPLLPLKSSIRNILSDRLGFNEVLTYSFVSKKLQEKASGSPENSYKIVNSISPELELFRDSLVPSLLEKTYENQKAGQKDFVLYELNQISKKSFGLNEENVPKMETHLAIVASQDFYFVKQTLLELEKRLGLAFSLKPVSPVAISQTPFEPTRSLEIFVNIDETEISVGYLGEIKKSVQKSFKLSENASALEISLDPCITAQTRKNFSSNSVSLSKYPSVSRDLTFQVSEDTPYIAIENAITSVLTQQKDLIFSLEPVSIFKKPTLPTKNLSFHLIFASKTKTLNSEEISDIIDEIINNLTALGAKLI